MSSARRLRKRRQDQLIRHRGGFGIAVAYTGWAIFGCLGAVIAAIAEILAPIDGKANVGEVIGALIVLMPLGAVLGALFGLVVQIPVRGSLRARFAEPAAPIPLVTPPAELTDSWAARYAECAEHVRRFHAVADTVDPGPAKDWLTTMGATLDRELVEAKRLARLGTALEGGHGGQSADLAARLTSAAESFAAVLNKAGEIAVALESDPDPRRIQDDLAMLAEQTPNLRHL